MRTRDKDPIKAGARDKKLKQPLLRVAGSLTVTRALGDGYLKRPELAVGESAMFVPYITAVPQVSVYDLRHCSPCVLVLASDGVWDHVSNSDAIAAAMNVPSSEVVSAPLPPGVLVPDSNEVSPPGATLPGGVVSPGRAGAPGPPSVDWRVDVELGARKRGEFMSNPSDRVVGVAMGKACKASNVSALTMRRSATKRQFHDDMTVVVVDLASHASAQRT